MLRNKDSVLQNKDRVLRNISELDTWIKKRSTAAVVRFPNFTLTSDDYFYSLLFLLLPHRDESELSGQYGNGRDAFLQTEHQMDASIDFTYFSVGEHIENAVRRIRCCT